MNNLLNSYNFDLPQHLIAQEPFLPKELTKLLVFNQNQEIHDRKIINLPDFFDEGDVLVFNDAKVIKAKLTAQNLANSAQIEFNLDQEIKSDERNSLWNALCKPAKKVKINDEFKIADDFFAQVTEKSDDGSIKINFPYGKEELFLKLEKYGSIPLPPYIKRNDEDLRKSQDQKNYQTIYAQNEGAVAAPTAGLHFNDKIFSLLEAKKINKTFVTLNVGAGTFLPVRTDLITDHKMHRESFFISKENAEMINDAKADKKRIIAVGTTALRAIESSFDDKGILHAAKTSTEIFIYPPYKFKSADILMTNFHLPKSTLFMLICAFVGYENAFEIYNHAIKNNYRFYSYGDTSLLFRKLDY